MGLVGLVPWEPHNSQDKRARDASGVGNARPPIGGPRHWGEDGMKRYRLYIRKPGSIAWAYFDTFEGAALAMMAQRLARLEYPGCSTRLRDAAHHADVATYVRDTAPAVQL